MSEENKDFADEAKETTNEFAEGAKEAANDISECLNNMAGGENKKMLVGILAIIFGSLGVHKFILGYQKEGIILLVATVVGWATLCIAVGGIILAVTWIIGVVEGIMYLTKSDEEFYNTYQVGRKPWF